MTLTVLMNAGPWLDVPPDGYGGIETVVATLVPELRARGVRVVLATVGRSTLEADEYVTAFDEPQFASIGEPYNASSGIAHAHMQRVVSYLREHPFIDVVHDHLEVVGPAVLAAMGEAAPPTLQTLHWDLRKHPDFYGGFDGLGRVRFAAVSRSQLDRAPANLQAQSVGVVPLAVPPPPAGPPPTRGDHALVLARVTPDKGQDIAAHACRAAGIPLVLAGPVAGVGDPEVLRARLSDPEDPLHVHRDVRFFVESVQPLLDGERVRWVGGVAGARKEQLLGTARVLLAPNRWAEPGATSVVEALGRGIPVIGTNLGVLPSLVRDGVTGFLVDGFEEIADRLGRVEAIDPAACRASVANWTPGAMAAKYLDTYAALTSNALTEAVTR